MRIFTTAVAILVATSSQQASAISGKGYNYHLRSFWGVIPYGGDDAPCTNDDTNSTATATPWNGKSTKPKSTSSKILDSVSAGGAFPSDAAFVGSTNTPGVRATMNKSPPFGTGDTPMEKSMSSMSVATNHQRDVDTVTSASEDSSRTGEEAPSPVERKKGPLKILFLSSDTGGGHRASAEALANQVSTSSTVNDVIFVSIEVVYSRQLFSLLTSSFVVPTSLSRDNV